MRSAGQQTPLKEAAQMEILIIFPIRKIWTLKGRQLGRRLFLFCVLLTVKSHFSLCCNQALSDSNKEYKGTWHHALVSSQPKEEQSRLKPLKSPLVLGRVSWAHRAPLIEISRHCQDGEQCCSQKYEPQPRGLHGSGQWPGSQTEK